MTTRDDQLLHRARQALGLVVGGTIVTVSSSFALYYVDREDPVRVFIAVLLAWTGYLFTHYVVTGKVVHQASTDTGACLIFAGLAIAAIAVGAGDLVTGSVALVLAAAGYVIAHYELTSTLL